MNNDQNDRLEEIQERWSSMPKEPYCEEAMTKLWHHVIRETKIYFYFYNFVPCSFYR